MKKWVPKSKIDLIVNSTSLFIWYADALVLFFLDMIAGVALQIVVVEPEHQPRKCNSYMEFAQDVLPRIKEAGYNCVPRIEKTPPHLHQTAYGFMDCEYMKIKRRE